MRDFPATVVADNQGRIIDCPELAAAGRSGRDIHPLDPASLIPLPEGSRLYLLPGRRALGFSPQEAVEQPPAQPEASPYLREFKSFGRARRHGLSSGGASGSKDRSSFDPNRSFSTALQGHIAPAGRDHVAVAAFLPPGYVALELAAFAADKTAPLLPLFCYCAVCWRRGRFYVPALRVDRDPKHDPSSFDLRKVSRAVARWLRQYPNNRLVAHYGLICVRKYGCPNAANLFLGRWEAPIAVAGGCNAACQGCISKQDSKSIPSPQARIDFVPTVAEIVEIAVPHLQRAPRALISFGQGCEGEPLLQGDLIEAAICEIRRRTKRGAIHLNTNGSLPEVVARLAAAGLDSIRISLNSARPALYAAYYRCRNYAFDDVRETFRVARRAGLWVSINYLTFPGVTDDRAEFAAFARLLKETTPQMIQWRNLNIDPDWYMDTVERACPSKRLKPMGIATLMQQIRERFPKIRFGYFNPPIAANL